MMNKASFGKVRLLFTAVVTLAIWALLGYGHFHGGVPSHHILADKDLPSFSNWWGALLLPVLTWVLLYRIEKRVFPEEEATPPATSLIHVLYGFAGALLFGSLLSVFFSLGNTLLPGYMLLGALALALFLPVYRAQCLLGFVIGMTYTFGAILPTGIGLILSLLAMALYLVIRPSVLFVTSKLTGKQRTHT
jgi:hypothetical protein